MHKKTAIAAAVAAAFQIAVPLHAWSQSQPADADKVESIVVQGQFLGSGAQSAMKQDVAVRDTPWCRAIPNPS